MADNIETHVRIVVQPDPDPDPSYLDQEEFVERKAEYQRGDFYFVGVYAQFEQHNWTTGTTVTARSGGLWGIESDSGDDYFREVGHEELQQLADLDLDIKLDDFTPELVTL